MNKNIRVRRPKEYDEFLEILRDNDEGVFDTLKSALIFAASVGFQEKRKKSFTESSEPVAISIFTENQDQPFIYCLALAESRDPSCLREENIKQTIENFEEYAAGGLEYMHENFETTQLKEEV